MSERTPVDFEEFDRWHKEAVHALSGAELQARGGIHNWACFGAEQAAQLAIKGLLHGLGKPACGHDLVELGSRLSELPIDVTENIAAALRRLERHYIPARYPDAHPSGAPGAHYGDTDWHQASEDARSILDFVQTIWELAIGGAQ